MLSNHGGHIILDKGKRWAHVLQNFKWWLSPLRRTFDAGLRVDFMQYFTDDRLAHQAMQCLAHEQGSEQVQSVHHRRQGFASHEDFRDAPGLDEDDGSLGRAWGQ